MKAWQKWALGLGAGAGLLWALTRRPFVTGLFTSHNYLGEPGADEAIARGGLALCLKLVNGTSTWIPEVLKTQARARALGVDASRAWGWHYLSRYRDKGAELAYQTDEASAIAEAMKAAEACRAVDARAYYVNAEAPVFGTEGWPDPTNPDQNLATFVQVFRSYAPGVELGFTGYVSRTSDQVKSLFDLWAPMLYGTLASDGSWIRQRQWNRWADNAAWARAHGQPFEPLVYEGPDYGQAQDYDLDSGTDAGLISRVATFQPAALWWWYWGPAEFYRLLTRGTKWNPPHAVAAGWARDAHAAGSSWPGTAARGLEVAA